MGILDKTYADYMAASDPDVDANNEYWTALLQAYPNRTYTNRYGSGGAGDYSYYNDTYGTNIGNQDDFFKTFLGTNQRQIDPQSGLEYIAADQSKIPGYFGDSSSGIEKVMNGLTMAGLGAAFGAGALGLAGGAGAGALEGGTGLGAGLEAAGGAASGLPESYWGMMADAGGVASDAAGVGAGTLGGDAAGGGMGLEDLFGNFDLSGLQDAGGGLPYSGNSLGGGYAGMDGGINAGGLDGALGDSAGNYTSGMGGNNPLTTGSSGGSNILDQILNSPRLLTQLLGSGVQGISSLLAARTQANSADQANNTLWNMFNQNRADLAPWRNAGATAVGQLTNLTTPGKQFDTMQLDPGYQFRLDQGQKALDNRLRAGGKFYSGSALKAGTDYNQGFASNEFGNVYNRLAGIAGTGQTATQNTAALGATTANNVAGNQTGAGNARASGYVGLGSAVQGGLQQYQQNELLNQLLQSPYFTGGR